MSETFEIYPIVVITENQYTEVQPNSPKEELQNIRLSYRLNGRNYLQWSQVEKTFLKGKRKLSHLRGTYPAQNDPTFVKWDKEDSMIMSWLWNLMLPEVSGTCVFLTAAREIWETVRQTYSKMQDTTLIYEIKTKITTTK